VLVALAALLCLSGVPAGQRVLWFETGNIETIDFTAGAGGQELAPQPPFQFVREEAVGTSPKVIVRDARGVEWRAKGGREVRAEAFVTRFVAALGYFAEPTWFIAHGRVDGINVGLRRASGFIEPDGRFSWAAFERRDSNMRFIDGHGWSWKGSPFAGKPQLNGLKIVTMLVSNWDNKDSRDIRDGSNTSTAVCPGGGEVDFINDWGQTLGRWGHGGFFGRQNAWDCAAYTRQTPEFVLGVRGRHVRFGYTGQHTDDFKAGITVDDVRWLMQSLGRITDAQIRAGLLASGATRAEEACFATALRARIERLRTVASQGR
jgi:hypothetical protein